MHPGIKTSAQTASRGQERAQAQELKDYTTTVTILESITDAIFILNTSGKIEYANRSAQDYLQLPLENIVGSDLGGFISSEDDETGQLLNRQFRSMQADSGVALEYFNNSEAELIGRKEHIPVLINFSAIPDGAGGLKYFIVTAKEIAYRKSLEKQLKNRQVVSVSFDRLKALGEMSVGLVHTLGQPVTAMKLRLEYMAQLESVEAVQDQILILRQDMDRLSSIVEKVRSYAQVMADKQNRSIDINDTIHSMLQILEYDLRAVNIVIKLNLDQPMSLIEANDPELEQVLLNLLTNAMQAFQVNEINVDRQISISTGSVEDKWVKIAIQDNAGGIPEMVIPKIFEPFFSTWDDSRHAGTGLSVARSILASLGGDLKYVALKNGSKFEMRIPISHVEERTQLINMIELLNS